MTTTSGSRLLVSRASRLMAPARMVVAVTANMAPTLRLLKTPSSLRVFPLSAGQYSSRCQSWHQRRPNLYRTYATETASSSSSQGKTSSSSSSSSSSVSSSSSLSTDQNSGESPQPTDATQNQSWEDDPDFNITRFSQLPHKHFGFNQHMIVNAEFKEALRQVLWQFKAPIRYAFAYGSGVFTQSSDKSPSSKQIHPNPPEAVLKWQSHGQKNIDFIFGVSFTEHWHSLNLTQHRDHYSFLGSLGSGIVSRIQDNFGAGAYFHPYININGMMIKYGVVNLDTMHKDLSEWDTMYLAGRLQKPVKILRDDARMRLANQVNLISALRTALLMLPQDFTEHELYTKIASISYMGDPRIAMRAESPRKVANIVDNQMVNFRQLYSPLIDDLPNITFNDSAVSKEGWAADDSINCKLQQDMDPMKRGNMVRRLPKNFRRRLYDRYQGIFKLDSQQFREILEESKDETTFTRSMGTDFDRRIAGDVNLPELVAKTVKSIINGPSVKEAIKGIATAGVQKSWRYLSEKRAKGRERKHEKPPDEPKPEKKATEPEKPNA